MPLLAALSCFQGQPAAHAAADLLALGFDGVQLTPGCAPHGTLHDELRLQGIPALTHHGYSTTALRRRVWSDTGELLNTADSIHPPKRNVADTFWSLAENTPEALPVVEVMYGSYALGTGREIRRAIELGLRLAVDVSHLHIQRTTDTATDDDVDALLNYDNVAEIHLSHNDGERDSHLPVRSDSYGLSWARDRRDTPVVFEGYLHRLSQRDRHEQLEILATALA